MSKREEARKELHKGNAKPAMDFNRKAQRNAPAGKCGGCIGAGTGRRCCMCGGAR